MDALNVRGTKIDTVNDPSVPRATNMNVNDDIDDDYNDNDEDGNSEEGNNLAEIFSKLSKSAPRVAKSSKVLELTSWDNFIKQARKAGAFDVKAALPTSEAISENISDEVLELRPNPINAVAKVVDVKPVITKLEICIDNVVETLHAKKSNTDIALENGITDKDLTSLIACDPLDHSLSTSSGKIISHGQRQDPKTTFPQTIGGNIQTSIKAEYRSDVPGPVLSSKSGQFIGSVTEIGNSEDNNNCDNDNLNHHVDRGDDFDSTSLISFRNSFVHSIKDNISFVTENYSKSYFGDDVSVVSHLSEQSVELTRGQIISHEHSHISRLLVNRQGNRQVKLPRGIEQEKRKVAKVIASIDDIMQLNYGLDADDEGDELEVLEATDEEDLNYMPTFEPTKFLT
jgi:hypothetical protein